MGNMRFFSDPVTRVGGEKTSYHIPTYEAFKRNGRKYLLEADNYVDCRCGKGDESDSDRDKGVRPIGYNGGNELSYYTYLRDVHYQVRAHFEQNKNHPELFQDWNENKHHNIAKRMVQRGGRRDVFLGTRECQAFVEPVSFRAGKVIMMICRERSRLDLCIMALPYAE